MDPGSLHDALPISIGSETSGGIRNVYIHDGLFDGSGRGVGVRTERGRGNVVENIWVRNITMRNLTHDGFSINTFFTGRSATGPAPLVRNRSEEHTSELQSRGHLVCRLLLAKKKK